MAVLLATRHHWTPEQVARLDEDFVTELLARERAEADVERKRQKIAERRASRRRGRGDSDEADLTEIS